MFPIDAKRVRKADLFSSLPPEPEDAKLTGSTRSLHRRLLALNLQPERMMVASEYVSFHSESKIA